MCNYEKCCIYLFISDLGHPAALAMDYTTEKEMVSLKGWG
jgi:hypothetical protein